MKAITLRNIPPEVARRIRQRAQEKRTSLNRAVLDLLEESLGFKRPAPRHHDLDEFFGTWSKDEADEFDRALKEQRRIDPELWS